jgi:hypothetical protein
VELGELTVKFQTDQANSGKQNEGAYYRKVRQVHPVPVC